MSKSKNNNPEKTKIEAKKDSVLQANKKSGLAVSHVIAVAVIVAAGVIAIVANRGNKKIDSADGPSGQGQARLAGYDQGESNDIEYDTAQYDDGKARYYRLKNGNVTIKYFILKSSDGMIRAAFDACDVCWPEGKGYAQEGDVMICKNCGKRFPSLQINVVTGGCNPATLKINVRDGKIIVKSKDVIEGMKYFDFTKRS